MPDLAGQFEQHLLAVSQEYTEITGTSPRRFLQMVSEHGGVETARILTSAIHPGEGFTRAWEHKCLHLTAEYLLVYGGDGAYQPLFVDDVIKAAKKRLRQYGVTTVN